MDALYPKTRGGAIIVNVSAWGQEIGVAKGIENLLNFYRRLSIRMNIFRTECLLRKWIGHIHQISVSLVLKPTQVAVLFGENK